MIVSVTFGTHATTRSPLTTPAAFIAAVVAPTWARSWPHVVSVRLPSSRIETIATSPSLPFDKRFSATFKVASLKNRAETKSLPGE
ncbi:unannotated protein [freshwater metagenome]|uniref:Unannotated protein n=1 Tax=freshwater metagenome TaxID=449393 RepID=A0A6J6M5V3_9ZZZZ